MSARNKAALVYVIVVALVLASWVGNVFVQRHNQLPEAGFLRHCIEATDNGGSFVLLYVSNRQDPRQIVGVTIDGLPWIRFQRPSEYMQMQYQRIDRLLAVIDPQEKNSGKKAEEPVVIREVTVHYSDGTSALKDVGEIRLYREAAMRGADQRPFSHSFSQSSSDGSGKQTIRITRPVTLTKVESAWLPVLGDAFEWKLTAADDALVLPAALEAGRWLSFQYQFHLQNDPEHSADVFQLIMKMTYEESGGQSWIDGEYVTYSPYLTNSQMRTYVRSQRREHA